MLSSIARRSNVSWWVGLHAKDESTPSPGNRFSLFILHQRSKILLSSGAKQAQKCKDSAQWEPSVKVLQFTLFCKVSSK